MLKGVNRAFVFRSARGHFAALKRPLIWTVGVQRPRRADRYYLCNPASVRSIGGCQGPDGSSRFGPRYCGRPGTGDGQPHDKAVARSRAGLTREGSGKLQMDV